MTIVGNRTFWLAITLHTFVLLYNLQQLLRNMDGVVGQIACLLAMRLGFDSDWVPYMSWVSKIFKFQFTHEHQFKSDVISSRNIVTYIFLCLFKVHLTPNFFLFAKKNYPCFGDYLFEKKYYPRLFMPRWSTENRTEIAAILAHDRVSKVKGLVTTVTSLREHDNLYFAPFRIVYLFIFRRLDRCWSQIAKICRTHFSLEVAVM